MGIRAKRPGFMGRTAVEGDVGILWKREGVVPAVPAFPDVHQFCPQAVHLSTALKNILLFHYHSYCILILSFHNQIHLSTN